MLMVQLAALVGLIIIGAVFVQAFSKRSKRDDTDSEPWNHR